MKLSVLQADAAGARRATVLLAGLLLGSMGANLLLAGLAMSLVDRERVIVVPPQIQKSFWVESGRASPEYLEQMGYFLLQLTLNVTPQSVDHQSRVLLGYAAPAVHGELKTTLANAAERLKRDGASTVFSARDLSVDARAMRVGVRGQLTTFISDRRVSDVPKGYVIELQWTNGRITLKSFRETDPHDPLKSSESAEGAPAAKSARPARATPDQPDTGRADVPDAGPKP